MITTQQSLPLSAYSELYDLLVPKDNILRQIHDLVDFQFVYTELVQKYTLDNGRPAEDLVRMFKYLLLKTIFDLSDVDVVSHTLYDLSFKYFLDLTPEDTNLIHPSSLTKFRRMRLKDMDLLDLLINKTVAIAIEHGIIKGKTIILDATHTTARSNPHNPLEVLRMRSKQLRHAIYKIDEGMRDKMPTKNTDDDITCELNYCNELLNTIEHCENISQVPAVNEKLNLLKECVEDVVERFTISTDKDARIGHKTEDSSFFGFKSHLAMEEESRIVTAAVVTGGDCGDGPQMQTLIDKTINAGIKVDKVIGDTAYSGKYNIEEAAQKGITVYAKLHPHCYGTRQNDQEFVFNKDANRYICPAGHMAIKRKLEKRKNGHNNRIRYIFDEKKCSVCKLREACLQKGAKHRVYNVVTDEFPIKRQLFEQSDDFKQIYSERYKIEAKNAELKNVYGYDKALYYGIDAMQLQSATTIFIANLKRIIKLKNTVK